MWGILSGLGHAFSFCIVHYHYHHEQFLGIQWHLFDITVVLNQQPISWLGFTAVLEAEQTWVLFLLGQTIQSHQFDGTFCPLAWKCTAGKIWFHWSFSHKSELLGTKSLQHSCPSSSISHEKQQATLSYSSSLMWLKDDKGKPQDVGMEGSRQGGRGMQRGRKGAWRGRQVSVTYFWTLRADLLQKGYLVSPQYSNWSQPFLQRSSQN